MFVDFQSVNTPTMAKNQATDVTSMRTKFRRDVYNSQTEPALDGSLEPCILCLKILIGGDLLWLVFS